MLINLSNHPSARWSETQTLCAAAYGEVVDMPFPAVDAHATSGDIDALVQQYFDRIMAYNNPAVMLQGEYVFTYRLVNRLKQAGITVLASCSERRVVQSVDAEGNATRVSVFVFAGFREY